MDIKPKYNTNTIKLAAPSSIVKLKTDVIRDPNGIIPNGIYKVIRWEKRMLLINTVISAIISLAMIIMISLFATVYKSGFVAFILPIVALLISGYKFASCYMESRRSKNEILKYQEDVKIGLDSTPPFLIRIYQNLIKKQIKHNWISFFLISNGAIITLLLWWLKDFHFWIFKFDNLIHMWFSNPDLMVLIFSISLLSIGVIHVYLAIQRKRKLIEIDSYLGYNAIPQSDINQLKESINKSCRRMFIIYLMIVFIIPVMIRFLIRALRKK